MRASIVIRAAMSAFILVLFVIAGMGWSWASTHQTASQALASHAVLLLSAVAGVIGLVALWRGSRASAAISPASALIPLAPRRGLLRQ